MPKFRKKPVEILAHQWTGENTLEMLAWINHPNARFEDGYLVIPTLEGNHFATKGDWIIKGIKGEFYPCKPDIFEATYEHVTMSDTMSFSTALDLVLNNKARVARKGWNGKGMFIFLVPGSRFEVNREPLLSILGEGTVVNYHGHIDMRTATGEIVPWLCSQTDMQANDWMVV